MSIRLSFRILVSKGVYFLHRHVSMSLTHTHTHTHTPTITHSHTHYHTLTHTLTHQRYGLMEKRQGLADTNNFF